MPENNSQFIIYILIGLLFAKEAFLPTLNSLFRKWAGLDSEERKVVEVAEDLVGRNTALDERFDSIDKAVSAIGSNHLHEVNDTLKRIETTLERNFIESRAALKEISEGVVHLKARLNGHNK